MTKKEKELLSSEVFSDNPSDWKPQSIITHTQGFISWIDSINRNFATRIFYQPFENYCKQSEQWLQDNTSIKDFIDFPDQLDYAYQEKDRIITNSLYFLDKNVFYKDEKTSSGVSKYRSYPAQKILSYLVDCGYNLIIGKGRQIFFTTTMGGIAAKKLNFHRSHFTKFITTTEKKGMEIFEDKIKLPLYRLEPWMRCNVTNDAIRKFRVASKNIKGQMGGVDSTLLVDTPNPASINGGSPSMILIDEADDIPVLVEMINEIMPTLVGYNPETRQQEMKRQLIVWTAGSDQSNSKAFEVMFKSSLDLWKKKDFSQAIVPIFFDYTARPGVTKEFYESQQRFYYSQAKINNDKKHKIQFHKHYPKSIDDLFLSTYDTVIPIERINNHLDRIYSSKIKVQKGYFEPLFDMNKPLDGNYFPYKPVGATFIPTSDFDERATVMIYAHPDKESYNRYYQGTDPIFVSSGSSKMASSIWDALTNGPTAILNCRNADYRYDYSQSILLGLYYGITTDVSELIESNVGKEYINMKDSLGLYRTLVPNKMLPPYLQTKTSSEPIGISKRTNTAVFISNKLHEMLDEYDENINFEEFYTQLKTYVKVNRSDGQIVFKTIDPKWYKDDIIEAVIYSYICRMCFSHLIPYRKEDIKQKRRIKRYVCNAETNYRTVLMDVYV